MAPEHGDDPVAGFLVGAGNRVAGSDAEASAHHDKGAVELFDVGGVAQGADHVQDGVALLKGRQEFRGGAYLLKVDVDGPGFPVPVGNRERDPFPVLVDTQHQELSGATLSRYQWRRNPHVPGPFRQKLLGEYGVH